ncbi:MAG TPA: RNA polymerase sigma factor [Kofleriaceae bacterium]|nr:RNA polymerase sigma factor [Kofleriaceae bacterium]
MERPSQRLCRLLEPLHAELRACARRLSRSSADGDDLFQEAALRALGKIDMLESEEAFRAWFYRVLLSVHRNRVKKSFWSRLVPLGDQQEPAVDVAGGGDPAGAERIRLALASLPAEQREAIVLHDVQEMSVDQIAEVQGVSPSAVKSRLVRGRKRLRSIYRKRFGVIDLAAEALVSGGTP